MPMVNGTKYPYTKAGKKKAEMARKKKGKSFGSMLKGGKKKKY